MNQIDFKWIAEISFIVFLGFILMFSVYSICQDKLFDKKRHFGYDLYKQKTTYLKAYFESLGFVIKYPIALGGFITAALSAKVSLITGFILCMIVLLPPALLAINKTLSALLKDAKKEYPE